MDSFKKKYKKIQSSSLNEKEDDFEKRMAEQKKRKEDEAELEKKLENHYVGLENHHDIIRKFTEKSYPINNHLWNKHRNSENFSSDNENEKNIKSLDNILKLHKTPENMILWSKTIHDPRKLKNEDNVVYHPAFISTSIQKMVAENNFKDRNKVRDSDGNVHNHILKINVSKGNHGVFIPDKYSIDKRAKEFILPRGSKLKYNKTDSQETHKNNFNHIHHMDLINE